MFLYRRKVPPRRPFKFTHRREVIHSTPPNSAVRTPASLPPLLARLLDATALRSEGR